MAGARMRDELDGDEFPCFPFFVAGRRIPEMSRSIKVMSENRFI